MLDRLSVVVQAHEHAERGALPVHGQVGLAAWLAALEQFLRPAPEIVGENQARGRGRG